MGVRVPCRTEWLRSCLVICLVSIAAGCATNNYETRPFFLHEYDAQSHGRKTILDRIVETDPGTFDVEVSPQYLQHPPARIAVLPFADVGSANFVVDKIPLTFRSKQQRLNWAWTDSQRLRRAFDGYLAQREFVVAPLAGIDAVLRAGGIDTPEKLRRVPPEEFGRLLGADAVVYGTVVHYEAYYLFLVAGWQVGVDIKMVSTRNGKTLITATGSRFAVQVLPALTLEDMIINSGENILQLRDIVLARAEEEACREIVHRIPVSEALKARLEEAALARAEMTDPSPHAAAQGPMCVGRGAWSLAPAPEESSFIAATGPQLR